MSMSQLTEYSALERTIVARINVAIAGALSAGEIEALQPDAHANWATDGYLSFGKGDAATTREYADRVCNVLQLAYPDSARYCRAELSEAGDRGTTWKVMHDTLVAVAA